MNKLSLMLVCASLSLSSHVLSAAEIIPATPNPEAATTAPPPPVVDEQAVRGAKFKKRCQEDPKWCEEKKAEIQKHREARKQWCAANPEACQKLKEEMKALKAQCKDAPPEQCATARKEMRQKMGKQKHDAQQKWCDANPQRCETWKAEARKIEDQYREARRQLQEKFPDRPQF